MPKTLLENNTPVIIVGAGPAGLFSSILLSRSGIANVVLERRSTIVQAPAAHVINTRTIEILREAGIPMQVLEDIASDANVDQIIWAANMFSPVIGTLRANGDIDSQTRRKNASSVRIMNISQNRLEAILLEYARSYELADIRYGHNWLAHKQGDQVMTCQINNTKTGQDYVLSGQYLIGADGANSAVARSLDIVKTGPESIADLFNITIRADLSALEGIEKNLLYWCLDPDCMGTMIVHDPKSVAVFMVPVFLQWENIETYTEAYCRNLIRNVIGTDIPFEITFKGLWHMTAQVAEEYQRGNIFLVGDSAHRFPPTGGLGLNTGVADAHNLAWKLAAVIKGACPPKILETYEAERKPVAQKNCEVSVRNFHKMDDVIRAFDLDPSKMDMIARLRNNAVLKACPAFVSKFALGAVYKMLRQKINAPLQKTQKGQALKARISTEINNQEEHFNMLGLEIGYIYPSGLLIDHTACETPQSSVMTYVKTTGAGARLPHIWVQEGETPMSAHDLLGYDCYTLFVNSAAKKWMAKLEGQFKSRALGLNIIPMHDKKYEIDPRLWAAFWELDTGGLLLVRPDGHIAWRAVQAVKSPAVHIHGIMKQFNLF